MSILARPQTDSAITLFPSLAYFHPKKQVWRATIHGRVFRDVPPPFAKRLMLRGLRRVLNIPPDAMESPIFQERVQGFLTTPETGQRVRVEIAGYPYRIRKKTKASGIFSDRIDIESIGLKREMARSDSLGSHKIPFRARLIGTDITADGWIQLASDRGFSVISDIDDTIKRTGVHDRQELLANTFLNPFLPIEGIADVYRHWEKNFGAIFHYVSRSPWQIYESLSQFIESHQFPFGSMHLRWFRLRDEMFTRWRFLKKKSKTRLIADLIDRMPTRRFVLVGDSSERDPEIYAKIGQKFADRTVAIVIRDVPENAMDTARLRHVQRKLKSLPLILFQDGSEIRDLLDELPSP